MSDGTVSAWQRGSARLAIGFAIFLAVAEVARNWGNWGYWAFWVVDYLAVALLAIGAVRTLRTQTASLWLSGGWGFTCAMFWMSFFSHLESLNEKGTGPIESHTLTVVIGVLFAITIVGLALALVGSRREGARA
jgi:hypothetical protein